MGTSTTRDEFFEGSTFPSEPVTRHSRLSEDPTGLRRSPETTDTVPEDSADEGSRLLRYRRRDGGRGPPFPIPRDLTRIPHEIYESRVTSPDKRV